MEKENNAPIDIVFTEELPADVICKKCGQVLRRPLKVEPCGHHLCTACLTPEMVTCPECAAIIEHEKTTPDKTLQRRIRKLGVQCTYKDNGCPWQGELRQLESHTSLCEFADSLCPNGCGTLIAKGDLDRHIAEDCLKRSTVCEYCKKSIPFKTVKNHLKACPEAIIDCPNGCDLKGRPRRIINDHLDICPRKGSVCPFGEFGCDYTGGKANLQKHIKNEPITHLNLLLNGLLSVRELFAELQLNFEALNRNMDAFGAKVDASSRFCATGQFIWRIDGYSSKLAEAKSGSVPQIASEPFTTGKHGYKLEMSAALWGDGEAHGKSLSVYLTILKGEYDALISWPFVHRVTFTLVDQNPNFEARQHLAHVVTPRASPVNDAFLERPTTDRNAAFGAAEMCELGQVERFVQNDALFIQCAVEVNNFVVL
uniref:RING-type E3 ubiquitin transferase n=1 Tax=Panagrellus redivivus TaxID=6233 RepID=A0A7E4W4J1_PANRE